MRLLVLGGTVFLGRAVVAEALGRGHHVTVFTRGKQGLVDAPGADHVIGDRRHDLGRLTGSYDAVIDTCGYQPGDVAQAAAELAGRVPFYLFVSSITVYDGTTSAAIREDHPTHQQVPDSEQITGATLGPLKAACERAVLERYAPDRAAIIRSGRIIGPYDIASRARVDASGRPREAVDYDAFAGRVPYWPLRAASGQPFIAPYPADQPLQLIDVRDLAGWLITLAETQRAGVFNATGPSHGGLTIGDLIRASLTAAAAPPQQAIWVDETFLLKHGIRPGTELPLWSPTSNVARRGHFSMDLSAARAAGLHTRPLEESVADLLAWALRNPGDAIASTSPVLAVDKEHALLRIWERHRSQANVT